MSVDKRYFDYLMRLTHTHSMPDSTKKKTTRKAILAVMQKMEAVIRTVNGMEQARVPAKGKRPLPHIQHN